MTDILSEALIFAAEHHGGQLRKSSDMPYIIHPVEVGAIIYTITDDVDVIAAGILHDTVEDTSATIEDIRERFGERIAGLVSHETENKRSELPASATWKLRKQETLEGLKNTTDRAVKIIWLGDKLSNARSLYARVKNEGDEAFNMFNEKDKKQHEWYYRTIVDYLSELSDTEAYKEFVSLVDKIFTDGDVK